jgi:hypothetical protein
MEHYYASQWHVKAFIKYRYYFYNGESRRVAGVYEVEGFV